MRLFHGSAAGNLEIKAESITVDANVVIDARKDFEFSSSGTENVTTDTRVKLADAYDNTKGQPGQIYQSKLARSGIDLSTENYTDTFYWTMAERGKISLHAKEIGLSELENLSPVYAHTKKTDITIQQGVKIYGDTITIKAD